MGVATPTPFSMSYVRLQRRASETDRERQRPDEIRKSELGGVSSRRGRMRPRATSCGGISSRAYRQCHPQRLLRDACQLGQNDQRADE